MERLAKIVATLGFFGYSPVASGTAGTLIACLVYYLLCGSMAGYFLVTVVVLILGFWSAGKAEKIFGNIDDRRIVIDEAAGLFISMFLVPFSLKYLIAGFVIFRIFDIIKPQPARACEKLPGSLGVMMDDIVCGIYTNILLHLLILIKF